MPPEKEASSKQEEVSVSRKQKSVLREYVEAFAIAVALALLIRTFVVQAFKIPSGSMLQTLQIGDHILVNKFIYAFGDPKRGDIIVFKYPEDPERDFIKRVVGLPGETLEIKNQIVYINNKPIEEAYTCHEQPVTEGEYAPVRDNFGPLEVPAHTYFTMGDNRDSSMDSRYWGPLDENMIRGKAFIVYWSIEPASNNSSMSLPSRFANWVVTLKDRIRWERFGKILH